MLKLAADENFNNNIIRGVLRRKPELDIIRVQDVGLSGADDPTILAWAAQTGRVLLTHDVNTITKYAYDRIEAGQATITRSRSVRNMGQPITGQSRPNPVDYLCVQWGDYIIFAAVREKIGAILNRS